ncbi:MAG: hypothetical protein IJ029_08540, partial [Lachnospiraceae bacterium]|nr:hypothetical protein [Lachnospiraceae bacterium]
YYQLRTDKQEEQEVCLLQTLPNVYYLCDEGIRMGKRFTGAMVGIYGYGGEKELTVTFMDFRYKE